MGIWKPTVPVESNRVLELNRGNPLRYTYTLPGNRVFPTGTTLSVLTIFNTYGQTLGSFQGTVGQRTISFVQAIAIADALPRGASWTLTVQYPDDDEPTMLAQGLIVRNEAPFPDAPPQSNEFDGVQYSYSFATTGFVTDKAWRVLNGNPRVYDNTSLSRPNAVAAGSLLGGDLTLYDDVAMLWFAPLKGDPVRLTYNVVKGLGADAGEAWVVLCSNYDMSNSAAIYHKQWFGSGDTVGIATGSGPVNYTTRASVNHSTNDLENYTAEYNPATNTFALYLGTSLTPVVSWQDATHLVNHGEGERYVGFAFKSGLLAPGVEISDWFINDSV